jgi:hypothetical protein
VWSPKKFTDVFKVGTISIITAMRAFTVFVFLPVALVV